VEEAVMRILLLLNNHTMSNETMKVIDQHESTTEALLQKARIIRMDTQREVAGALAGND